MELVSGLRDRGIAVYFVMVDDEAAAATIERFPDARVDLVENVGHGLRRDLAIARAVRARIRSGVGVVHANTTSASRATALAVTGTRARLIVHLRNSASSVGERALIALLSRRSRTSFIAVSELARGIAGAPPERVTVIPNPVLPPLARAVIEDRSPKVIGVVTSGNPVKGFDRLVEIAEACRDLLVRFEVFGVDVDVFRDPGSFAGRWWAEAERRGVLARMTFNAPTPTMRSSYADLDAVLVVSRRESFGRVAVEAMRSGVPLVIPDIAGLLETTRGGADCWVYDTRRPAAAGEVIRVMLAQPAEVALRAQRAQARARRFDPGIVAAKVDALYADMMGSSVGKSAQ
jgi:glycosyltransferase involved in cell wall biosynthesis